MDRGWRPRGSLPEPGADEEQPVGGERKVHPSLEETNYPAMTFQLLPPPSNTHLQMTPEPDPACEGHVRTAPPNFSP